MKIVIPLLAITLLVSCGVQTQKNDESKATNFVDPETTNVSADTSKIITTLGSETKQDFSLVKVTSFEYEIIVLHYLV